MYFVLKLKKAYIPASFQALAFSIQLENKFPDDQPRAQPNQQDPHWDSVESGIPFEAQPQGKRTRLLAFG